MSDAQVAVTTNQLLNAKALAQILALSKRQIHRLDSSGRLPIPIRIGGAVRWSASEISDWLAAGAPNRTAWEARKAVKGVKHAG